MDRRFMRGRGRRLAAHSRSHALPTRPASRTPAAFEALESRQLFCLAHLVESGHVTMWAQTTNSTPASSGEVAAPAISSGEDVGAVL